MREIQSPDLTWSADLHLNGPSIDLRGILEMMLKGASEAGLLRYDETPEIVSSLTSQLQRDGDLNVERQIGQPGIKLCVSVRRNSWGRIFLTNGRTKRYTVHINAAAMPQPPQG
ncbi:hypothetical protein [Actinomadura coerulea]|uniref:hypothetical protein n=1 Tax=Actinomadura coerulea TaxID=46159 RepID=UPI003441098D